MLILSTVNKLLIEPIILEEVYFVAKGTKCILRNSFSADWLFYHFSKYFIFVE